MSKILYCGQEIYLSAGESVLNGLLRSGVSVPNSCRSGVCQSCLLRCGSGRVPEKAQAGLRDTLKTQGYFLACCCHPSEDLEIQPASRSLQAWVRIIGLEFLSETVLRVLLRAAENIEYKAGQFVTLIREDGLARSYSVASLPDEGHLELHVRRIAGGLMSGWLHEDAQLNTPLRIQGPSGNCFYVPGTPEQSMLLAGTGTGLAPLYGILRDALSNGHTGPIRLFHGAVDPTGLYLTTELEELADRHSNFEYIPVVLKGEAAANIRVGQLDQVILSQIPALAGWKGYLCGDPGLVNSLRKKLFLSGMRSKDIYADPFIPSAGTEVPIATDSSRGLLAARAAVSGGTAQ
jgi:NAD(P)H-flavin reductase/ferredoxin